jgi:hypothetical protein
MKLLTMPRSAGHPTPAKDRIARLFQFFRAYHEQEHPVPRHITEQPWCLELADVPRHSSIIVNRARTSRRPRPVTDADTAPDAKPIDDDIILIVRRPRVAVRAEVPDEAAADEAGDPSGPASQALRLFEDLYELHALMEREGERHELVLGDGVLSWNVDGSEVEHPILLQRLQLEFDPDVPEFRLRESTHPPEVYSSLFSSIVSADGRALARIRDRFNEEPCHPLGGPETADFLSFAAVQLSPRGRVVSTRPREPGADPAIFRHPVVFQRTRTLGYATAIEAVLSSASPRTSSSS